MIPESSAARPEDTVPDPVPLKKSVSRPLSGRRKNAPSENGNEIWFLTLSDLLLLLVIFFVLLFGLSWQQQNQPRSAPVASAQPPRTHPVAAPVNTVEALTAPPISGLEKELEEFLGTAAVPGVTLERRGPALVLTFPEQIVFDTGEARLKPEADPTLAAMGTFVALRPELLVEVHGHTDDRPIRNSRYPSNWELSAARATQVARALIARGTAPRQISVKGFGEYQALAPNDSETNRLKNRRVEVHFSFPGGIS
ncbi:MAG: flagellar motor protein MotB [Deltaproteobacteria bacterium]|nr:flagellar motor protein MotB [Deltaproteobacteria bacterium]